MAYRKYHSRMAASVFLIILLLSPAIFGNWLLKGSAEDILWVNFCDLRKDPTKYDQKLIATQAISVTTVVFQTDGGDTFLYSNQCINEKDAPEILANAVDLKSYKYFSGLENTIKDAIAEKTNSSGKNPANWPVLCT
ncbi:MAG: hypothetical protein U0X75_20700 [Acidobacteriota bacterium]